MLQIAMPALAAILAWWVGTGVVMYLVGLPRRTHRYTQAGATIALLAALWGLGVTAADATETGAYVAFSCAIVVWGWQEVCFLTGVGLGPRTGRCPDGVTGWKRFVVAAQAILFHELQLVALIAVVVLVTAGGSNPVGLWAFLVLWAMRLSAKLNLFLGVPFLYADLLPAPLRYLASYFSVRPMNWLFPFSVTLPTILAVLLVQSAVQLDTAPFDATIRLLAAALLALAVLEHWFMVLPLPVAALWPGFKARETEETLVFPASTIDRRGT